MTTHKPDYRPVLPVNDTARHLYLREKLKTLTEIERYWIEVFADEIIAHVKDTNGNMQMSRDGAYSVLASLGSWLNGEVSHD